MLCTVSNGCHYNLALTTCIRPNSILWIGDRSNFEFGLNWVLGWIKTLLYEYVQCTTVQFVSNFFYPDWVIKVMKIRVLTHPYSALIIFTI